MSHDYGTITPDKSGKWVWPYAHMQEGDTFKVSAFDRTRASVANMSHTRARQLDKRFAVHTDGEFTHVECTKQMKRIPGLVLVDWFAVKAKMDQVYGEGLADRIPWHELHKPSRMSATAIAELPDKPFLADMHPNRLKITLLADMVLLEPIDTLY